MPACSVLPTSVVGFAPVPSTVGFGSIVVVVFVFVVVAFTDIGAYYFGSKFGKHKLAEVISPKKTVEGAIGGGACALAFSILFAYIFNLIDNANLNININLTLAQAIMGGLIITISAQLGDLSESLIKRDAGVKDSSALLPGHGGMLDRFDGYIFAIPVSYYFFKHFCCGANVFVDFCNYIQGFINAYF